MRASSQQSRKQAPVINFACPTAQSGLTALIARLNAAVAEVEKWGSIEDRLSIDYNRTKPDRPKVYGGRTGPSRIIREGHDDVVMEAYDWFYSTREAIERDRATRLAEASTDDTRAEVEQCFAGRLADWDRQERACKRAVPKALREAKRHMGRAHKAWSVAELAIVNYQPQTMTEVAEWLAYAGRGEMRGVFFSPDEGDLKHIMRTAAAVLAEHGVN
ncbi:hypothetical protein [Bradyrhizobium sp. WU425]|uniref:hypothetical protein n=1 Tax=Bradyrhizobium sp. WU425 TaxID=187029 RepID=UPI001E3A1E01|nr:hypothetical protein [Bradyrhizobium canariense]UFW75484.1 hypothetical protein BcanWU425_17635 [Bradyrhizobium canariense]